MSLKLHEASRVDSQVAGARQRSGVGTLTYTASIQDDRAATCKWAEGSSGTRAATAMATGRARCWEPSPAAWYSQMCWGQVCWAQA